MERKKCQARRNQTLPDRITRLIGADSPGPAMTLDGRDADTRFFIASAQRTSFDVLDRIHTMISDRGTLPSVTLKFSGLGTERAFVQ